MKSPQGLAWKTVWQFLRKLSMELLYDLASLLLGLYSKHREWSLKQFLVLL
jgi:hypothetical protein